MKIPKLPVFQYSRLRGAKEYIVEPERRVKRV